MAAAGAAAVAYWAATALAVASTAYAAYNSRQSAKAQSKQAEENAKNAESQGRVEAERIRELGKKQKSAAQAQMAANGLDLNANDTAVDTIEKDIDLNSSKDAWTTFFNAKNQSAQFKTDAQNYNLQARQATVGGVLNTASTTLSAFGNAPKNATAGKTTTQPISGIQSNTLTMDTSRIRQNASGWA
ncbi:hypothetical protein [Acinetobacter lwoffii]|uniref:hypothetical protein n=1 Tax=Acinetobacter lwoffii TaxID=28090 RepID=UPI00168D14F4|nr:hypothetical protein [Acinetobacter lwoffii]